MPVDAGTVLYTGLHNVIALYHNCPFRLNENVSSIDLAIGYI